jgi:hypothetical protein
MSTNGGTILYLGKDEQNTIYLEILLLKWSLCTLLIRQLNKFRLSQPILDQNFKNFKFLFVILQRTG